MATRLRWTIASLVVIVVLLRLLVSWFNGPTYWFASAIAFSPDGKQLVVGTYRWQRIPPPDTPRFLVGEISQSVRILNPQSGSLVRRIEETRSSQVRIGIVPEPVSWISFAKDGASAAIGHWDGEVTRYKTPTWDVIDRFGTADGRSEVRSLVFLQGDENLWIAYRGYVAMRGPADLQAERPVPGTAMPLRSTSVSDDDRLLAVGGRHGGVTIIDLKTSLPKISYQWDARTGELTTSFEGNLCHIDCGFVPGSTDLVVTGEDGETVLARIIDTATGGERRRLPARRGRIRFSPDARLMAIGGGRGLSIFDAVSWSEQYRNVELSVQDLAFSPDSRTLVVGTTAGEVRCLDVETREVLWKARVDDF